MGYTKCTFAEKTTLALFNWYMIFIDDMCSKDIAAYSVFQERFLRGQPQLNPILDALVEVLLRFFDQYDAPTANSILSASLDFVNSNCIEPKLAALSPVPGAVHFPWYFRDRAGMAIVYALMMFPKTKGVVVSDYVQVLQEMNFWIALTNDVLSFHKEELAGEKNNYIHNRAHIEGKTPLGVYAEVVQELHQARKAIRAGLAHNQQAMEMWVSFEQGYMYVAPFPLLTKVILTCVTCRGWHVVQKRYKLADLNL
ncbi:isoprenoid synthase domain-containing protein [Collybia nuda]|uniref:Isoprenoid synthase domain-containing protein n=1 Tax=Collybia nuda TaxID=64659 RepID=A0A9P5XWL0_9AGAR|nr:isoprenoid synthase domain-containing protein [Collybia nuda]